MPATLKKTNVVIIGLGAAGGVAECRVPGEKLEKHLKAASLGASTPPFHGGE